MLSLYRRHLKTCPNAADRFVRKGDKCPVWVEGVDPQGIYHRRSLRTGSWDIGERLMRDVMVPAVPDPPADVARPEIAPPMALESAISTFIANLEGENRAPDTIRKYRLMFLELQGFADRHRVANVAELNFEKLVAFRKTWTQQGAQTRNK